MAWFFLQLLLAFVNGNLRFSVMSPELNENFLKLRRCRSQTMLPNVGAVNQHSWTFSIHLARYEFQSRICTLIESVDQKGIQPLDLGGMWMDNLV